MTDLDAQAERQRQRAPEPTPDPVAVFPHWLGVFATAGLSLAVGYLVSWVLFFVALIVFATIAGLIERSVNDG